MSYQWRKALFKRWEYYNIDDIDCFKEFSLHKLKISNPAIIADSFYRFAKLDCAAFKILLKAFKYLFILFQYSNINIYLSEFLLKL